MKKLTQPTLLKKRKSVLKKCLGEEDGDGKDHTGKDAIDTGDLDRLFAEDTTDTG